MITTKNFKSSLLTLSILALLLMPLYTKAQLVTNNSLTPTQLVQTVLLGGGLTATNITYSGNATAIGSFVGTSSNIGFAGGIIMASGNISNAVGPNNIGSQSTTFGTTSSDPQLSAIASGSINDAAILEFDFIPGSDTISFRYVFGSEEYMEFANTNFNDVFGFFISGPNPAGGAFTNQNIAIVPGTATPVSINNVNLTNNGSFYFDNGDGNGLGTAPDGQTVQYDGFTVPLTAVSPVICGQQYHIKIAISDVGDGNYDSGVFLEAGSFSSAGSTSLSSSANNFGGTVAGDDSTIYEGCGFASLLVLRTLTDSSVAQTLYYTVSGTATSGDDYTPVTDSIHFTATQDSALITINSIEDGIIEGTETAIISLFINTPCGGSDTLTKTLYIIDTPPLKVSLNDDTALVCPTQNVILRAQAAGGVAIGGRSYHWLNFPGTSDTLNVSPDSTTTYYVTVSDSCGHVAMDSCTISFTPYDSMHISMNNDTSICGGQHVFISSTVTDGLPVYNYAWSPDIGNQDTATVTPANTTSYILTVTDVCAKSISDTITITVSPINADFDYTYTTNQTIQFNDQSSGAITHNWNFGDASEDSVSTDTSPVHTYASDGSYIVTLIVSNQDNCIDTVSKPITIVPDFYFYIPNSFTPNKNGLNDVYKGSGVGIKTYRMRIFDRWGKLVFESNDEDTGWDGNYKGGAPVYDTYVCVFDLEDYNYKHFRRYSTVTLVH